MRIDKPGCDFTHCRYRFDGNCTAEGARRDGCQYRVIKDQEFDWFELIALRMRDYSEGDVWCAGGDEILCRTQEIANAIEDLLFQLYASQGEEVAIISGYYDPCEDKRNAEEDSRTGWWYVYVG